MLTEIYRFTSDELETPVCVTSGQTPVMIRGETFVATAISRNALRVGTEETPTNALEITLPVNHDLVTKYLQGLQRLEVKVSQINEDQEFTIFNGRVTRLTIERNSAKFVVPTLYSHALQASVPIVRFHRTCNHVLYDDRCRVAKAPPHVYTHAEPMTATFNGVSYSNQDSSGNYFFTINSVNGREVTLGNIPSGFNTGNLIGGYVNKLDSSGDLLESRSIARVLPNLIILAYESTLQARDPIEIAVGCDHNLTGDCRNLFMNCENYGGFPLVPSDNPFLGTTH